MSEMTSCQIRGCRSLETKCTDCGRVVNKATMLCGEWISVKDRLPKKSSCYLIWTLHSHHLIGRFNEQKEWDWEDVTHWQPLPEPPEEKE